MNKSEGKEPDEGKPIAVEDDDVQPNSKQEETANPTLATLPVGTESMQALENEVGEIRKKINASMKNGPKDKSAFQDEGEGSEDEDDNAVPRTLVRQTGAAEVIVNYEEPSEDKIKAFIKKRHLRDPETGKRLGLYSTRVSPSLFNKKYDVDKSLIKLGPGVSSYFYFLKLYALLFVLLGLISLPVMIVSGISDGNEEFQDFNSLMSVSVGNLRPTEDEKAQKEYVSYLLVITDMVIVLVFLVVSEYSIFYFKKQQVIYEVEHPNLEQFSVEVTNLPSQVTFSSLKRHFEGLVKKKKLYLKDQEDEGLDEGGDGNEDWDLEMDGEIVDDVQLVTTTKDKLTFAIKSADLASKVDHMEAKYSLAQKKVDEGKISQARFNLIQRDYKNALVKLKLFWEENAKFKEQEKQNRTIKAFVTFTSVQLAERVIELYNKKLSFKLCFKEKDEELLFEDKEIVVKQAAPPSLLKWENIEYANASRQSRGCAAFFLVVLVLLFSSICLLAVSKLEQNGVIGQAFNEEQLDLLSGNSLTTGCSAEELNENLISDENIDLLDGDLDNLLVLLGCENQTDIKTLSEVCVVGFDCFCDLSKASQQSRFNNPICRQIYFAEGLTVVFLVGSALLVSVFNVVLELIISGSVSFEKKEDRSVEEKNLFIRLFIASYINTAVVKFITHLNFQAFGVFNFGLFGAIDGDFDDFTSDWYNVVGTDLVLIGLSSILSPHILTFVNYVRFNLKNWCLKPISIEDIKRNFLGPEFSLPLRYAQAMVVIFFTLTYSGGIPLLYFIGAVALFAAFCVDKFFLFYFFRTPPLYTNEIVLWVSKKMKYGIIIHTAAAVYFYSARDIFPNDRFDAEQLTLGGLVERTTGTFPIVLLTGTLFLLILFHILTQFEVVFVFARKVIQKLTLLLLKVFLWLFSLCCCRKKKEDKGKSSKDVLEGFKELQKLQSNQRKVKLVKSELVGLNSYNILANPLYSRRLKLKGNVSASVLLQEGGVKLHSTLDVINQLESGQDKAGRKFVFQREDTVKTNKKKPSKLRKMSTRQSVATEEEEKKKDESGRSLRDKIAATLKRNKNPKKSSMPEVKVNHPMDKEV